LSELEELAAKRMRMLRLGEGWSAEKLSQEYEKGGTDPLTRTTIAKIESDRRRIKAGEVAGVARVFGLNLADLLDPDGQKVFLSYAEQDRETGQQVADWLRIRGFRVTSANLPALGAGNLGSEERYGIDTADAYVALLSPGFLGSPRCREELKLAVRRKQQLMSVAPAAGFIFVLRVADTSDLDDSELRPYSPIDLPPTGEREIEVALSKLGGGIISEPRATGAHAKPQDRVQSGQGPLDHGEDLDHVLYNLSSPAGSYFWLVTSPPGLGKSTFLEQLATKIAEATAVTCPAPVDLHEEPAAVWNDALPIVTRLFGIEQSQTSEADYLVQAAQKIDESGQLWLCLLDGAELLPESTVTQLRHYLGKIHRMVEDRDNARLAFVVASRRTDGWIGLYPNPGLSVVPLGGFRPGAIQNALEGLAADMRRTRSPAELREDAAIVHRVTQGLPELVEQSLQWIKGQNWLAIELLETSKAFGETVSRYVQDRLLTLDSLLPGTVRSDKSEQRLRALKRALRVLVPYRFFARSHVAHYHEADHSLRATLKDASWTLDQLWDAITGMALLYFQPDDAWHEIHPALRRLLFRHFYAAADERATAHQDARDLNMEWAAEQTGREQIVVMVESIWHEAARLRLSGAATMGKDLLTFVGTLSGGVRKSPQYTEVELRNYAAQRMRNDDELQREIADPDLFEELVKMISDARASGGLT